MSHNPILTIDTVPFHWDGVSLKVLLEKRDRPPFEDHWALPGGFVHTNEDRDLEVARDRILKERICFKPGYFEKVDSIGSLERDPRGWAVSVIYLGIIDFDAHLAQATEENLMFVEVSEILNGSQALAFDHKEIVRLAFQRLAIRCGYSSISLLFMPKDFTIRMLLDIHKALMGSEVNKMSVIKRYVNSGTITAVLDEKDQPVKIASPTGPRAAIYRHNMFEPINFMGVISTTDAGNG